MKRFLTLITVGILTQAGVPPVRTMYNNTLAMEQKVRATLNAPDAPAAIAANVRAVVAAYQALVHRYPASGYSDNALWQAGRLELDLFAKFGDAADRDAGVKLLRRLTTNYPASSLVPQVPAILARLSTTGDEADAVRASEAARAKARAPQESRAAQDTRALPDPRSAQDSTVAAPTTGRLATIRGIRRSVLPDAVRITIELDAEVPFHEERIADPARVFVDLPGTRAAAPLVDQTLRFNVDADIVRQVRVGRHPNNTTRVVLDAAGVTSYSVYPLYGPFRLVIDCVRPPAAGALAAAALAPAAPATTFTAAATRTTAPVERSTSLASALPVLVARPLTRTWPHYPPSMTPRSSTLLAQAHSAVDTPPAPQRVSSAPMAPVASAAMRALPPPPANAPAAASPSSAAAPKAPALLPAAPPAKNANGGLSIARQLGLGVSRIVIDAGHGGHDPGAQARGVTEAELVLDVALRLEKLLQKVQGVETILTRRSDDFVPLPERTAIANREGADLFLSIHANASPNPQARGVETYFLNFANNVSAAAVAARENAASTLAMGEMPDIVKAIATSNKVDESRDFANHVQRAMSERLRTSNKTLRDLGVKQAPFVVLIGATMPAVLAEISFVTNPQEAKLLKSGAYRQKIAESLFNAIRKYQTSLKASPTIALQ